MHNKGQYIKRLTHAYRKGLSIKYAFSHAPIIHNISYNEIWGRSLALGREIILIQKTEGLFDILKNKIWAMEQTGRLFTPGLIFWAECLTNAKGRFQRDWYAPFGGIYLTMAIHPDLPRSLWHLYGQMSAVAICKEIKTLGGKPSIRWISDVLIKGKKCAGILVKATGKTPMNEEYIMVGMGINVNIASFPKAIRDEATSICLESDHEPDHIPIRRLSVITFGSRLMARLSVEMAILHSWYARYIQEELQLSENPVIKDYKSFADFVGKDIIYADNIDTGHFIEASVKGINDDGSLLMTCKEDVEIDLISIYEGEIRVKVK